MSGLPWHQARGLMEAIDYEMATGDNSLYRARWATIYYAPGRADAARTASRRRRAGSRRTKRLARR